MKSIRAYLVAAAVVIIASPVTITHADEPPLGDPPLVNEVPNNCGISISADQNWLSVNDNDDNNDEIWDFETESGASGAEPVVGEKDTLKITVTGTADKSDATVTVSIETGSDKIDGFWEGTLTISGQTLTSRQLEELAQKELEGQKKDSSKKTTFTFTVPIGRSATQTLYIEGIKHSDSLKDVKINARVEAPAGITPDPDNRPFRASSLAATPLEITVYQVDLDVDSNNDNAFDFAGFDDAEDKIEASEKEDANGSKRPGKIVISSSQTNSDGDDVPDFADGFNLPFTGTVNELEHVSETLKFVPVQVELKAPFDTASAKVKFTYDPVSKPELSEDDIGVTGAGTPEDPYVFNLNKGGMRLWKKKATERTSGFAVPSGDFVPADTEINWSDIATDISTPRKAKLYLEYVDMTPAEAAGRKNITVTATQEDVKSEDKVIASLVFFDVDVDADNTTVDNYPDQSQSDRGSAEEVAEDKEGHPGVRVYANLIDADTDGIPGYADGIDKFGNGQANSCWKFEPLIIEVASLQKFPNSKFKLKYSASDPDQMTQQGSGADATYLLPEDKVLRIWKKDGDEVRKPQGADQDGDFIADDQEYSAEELGWQEGETTIRLYIEVVIAELEQSFPIEVEFYPIGTSRPECIVTEKVKVDPYYISQENLETYN